MTRAKFYCTEARLIANGRVCIPGGPSTPATFVPGIVYGYRFSPVIGDSPENKAFFTATPAGSIELQLVKPGIFEVGREYYVDFTPAEVAR